MISRTNTSCWFLSILVAGFLAGCASTAPPLPEAGTSADPHVHVSTNRPNNLLASDETTIAIRNELSRTESRAKSAESMQQMGQGDMPGMQHGDTKMEGHKDIPNATDVDSEKRTVADEMKKTSDEMKKTSDAMEERSEQKESQNFYYTCRMHPQIHADKPGNCPICGMALIKKEGPPPK